MMPANVELVVEDALVKEGCVVRPGRVGGTSLIEVEMAFNSG